MGNDDGQESRLVVTSPDLCEKFVVGDAPKTDGHCPIDGTQLVIL
tara:strand:+ start:556 stop:690 length:135 start_codon:yes stop_codon:yes gene_type:complete